LRFGRHAHVGKLLNPGDDARFLRLRRWTWADLRQLPEVGEPILDLWVRGEAFEEAGERAPARGRDKDIFLVMESSGNHYYRCGDCECAEQPK
jgi:hypothetical protein